MSKDFDAIIQESRAKKFAIILDGVEMNLVMLALEMIVEDDRVAVARGTLAEVLAHLKVVVGKGRFVDLVDLKNLPEVTEDALRETLEQRFLDGASGEVNTGDGSR